MQPCEPLWWCIGDAIHRAEMAMPLPQGGGRTGHDEQYEDHGEDEDLQDPSTILLNSAPTCHHYPQAAQHGTSSGGGAAG